MGAAKKETKEQAEDRPGLKDFLEAISRVNSHLVVLAEGQDAILRAMRKKARYG